jgi:tetratricopeptide (TPR) repeat protein
MAVAHNNMGKAYYLMGNNEWAEKMYLEAARLYQQIKDQQGLAGIYNNLGILYRGQGDYDKALQYYNMSRGIRDEINDENGIARVLNNIGEIYKFRGDFSNAMLNYQASYEIKKELGDRPGMANTLNNLGEIYNFWGEHEEALNFYQESYTIRRELGDNSGMAASMFNIGSIYKDISNYDQALEYLSGALDLYETLSEKRGMASCYNMLGEVYLEEGNYDLSIDYFLESFRIEEELNNQQGNARSLQNLGQVFLKQEDYDRAIGYYQQALDIYNSLGNQKGIAEIYIHLADANSKKENYQQAIRYYDMSIELSGALNLRSNLVVIYGGLANLYENLSDYSRSLEYYRMSIALRDSLTSEAVQNNINALETRYQTEQKEKEIQLKDAELMAQAAEIKQKNAQQVALIIGIALFMALAAAIFIGYRQKQHANQVLSDQKAKIEQINMEITDSIRYAKHIQNAILPSVTLLQERVDEAFVYYRPKAIVSGDFYWFELGTRYSYVAAVDATGHGVPGAFISLLGYNILNTTVGELGDPTPAELLDGLNSGFSERLSKAHPEEMIKDSMDIALCRIDHEQNKLEFAGAYNPLWLIRDGEIQETRGDKFPIGAYYDNPELKYTNHSFDLNSGDAFYIFSDGYADQFGGPHGKKFRYKKKRELLLSSSQGLLKDQYNSMDKVMVEWMGEEEQIDDMLVIGIRMS